MLGFVFSQIPHTTFEPIEIGFTWFFFEQIATKFGCLKFQSFFISNKLTIFGSHSKHTICWSTISEFTNFYRSIDRLTHHHLTQKNAMSNCNAMHKESQWFFLNCKLHSTLFSRVEIATASIFATTCSTFFLSHLNSRSLLAKWRKNTLCFGFFVTLQRF